MLKKIYKELVLIRKELQAFRKGLELSKDATVETIIKANKKRERSTGHGIF